MATNAKKVQHTVFDTQGTAYELVKKVGEGGQGKVISTNHKNLIIKISDAYSSEDKREQDFERIQQVARRPIRDLKIALPIALLKLANRVGYVMELMDNLESLSHQIERIQEGTNGLDMGSYRDTGGLSRRLSLLLQLAETLSKLHGRGLCYGDLSPSNIFVSSSFEHHEVWLIDADNIKTQESSNQASYYTKGYAAPEVIRGESENSTWTDCWSFAVIALQLLTHTHPFNSGIAVEDEDPDIAEEKAERGEYPWIYDYDDDTNVWTESGMPLEELINERLFSLFERCFSQSRVRSGLHLRPSMSEWYHELHRSHQMLVNCQNTSCHSSFILDPSHQCFFCKNKINSEHYLTLAQYLRTDEPIDELDSLQDIDCNKVLDISLGDEKYLYDESYSHFDIETIKPWCTLKLTERGLSIIPNENETVVLMRLSDSKEVEIQKERTLPLNSKKQVDYAIKKSYQSIGTDTSTFFFWRFTW